MKVVDIKNRRPIFAKKLELLGQSLDFKGFIDLLCECLQGNKLDVTELQTFWQRNKDSLISTDYLLESLPLLCRVQITYPLSRCTDEKISPQALEAGWQFIEVSREREHSREPFREKYSWFYPSLWIAPLLEASYPAEIDPGRMIAKYIQVLFPEENEYQDSDLRQITDNRLELTYATPAWLLLNDLACWVGECSTGAERQRLCFAECLLDLLDPRNRSERGSKITLAEKLLLLHHAPNELFHAWMWGCFLASDEYGSYAAKLSTADLKAALLTLAFGTGEQPLALSLAFGQLADASAVKFLTKKEGKCLSWQAFYSLLYRVKADDVQLDAECRQLLQALMGALTNFRRTFLGGISPVVRDVLWGFSQFIFVIGTDKADLLQLLADGDLDCTFLDLIYDENSGMSEERHASYYAQAEFYNNRQEIYLQLFAQAHAEGLYELGTSLLSLYLFYRAVYMKGRLNFSSEMVEAINKALVLPGARTLRHTLKFAVESVERYFSADPIANCSALILRQFLPQGAVFKVLPGGVGQEGAISRGGNEVESFLVAELGESRWGKLSENSRSCLVSAELQWKLNAHEFGFGIKDWSGLITTYCKAIEGELVDRLSDFFDSNEYESYLADKNLKRPTKATAGWLLKELRSFEHLPENLQELLNNSRIHIACDKDIVNRLYDVVQNYRNISAHHSAVSMKQFADFKEKMFQSGLLHRFIDAFA